MMGLDSMTIYTCKQKDKNGYLMDFRKLHFIKNVTDIPTLYCPYKYNVLSHILKPIAA